MLNYQLPLSESNHEGNILAPPRMCIGSIVLFLESDVIEKGGDDEYVLPRLRKND